MHFKNLTFTTDDSSIQMQNMDCFSALDSSFVQIQIAGENKDTYPAKTSVELNLCREGIQLTCPETPCAVFLEILI